MGYPQVAVYRWPIYFTSPILSTLFVLYYLSGILLDWALSYRIYQPGGVSNGPDAAGYPQGGVSYVRGNPTSLLTIPILYPTGYGVSGKILKLVKMTQLLLVWLGKLHLPGGID